MRRLFEHPTDQVTVREAYEVHRPRPADRPWLGVCMVASIDGSTVIDSNSRALSSKTDQEVLLTLRDLADVILVGAATVRIEGYGPPRKAGQRVGVVSRTGNVDVTSPLFTSGAGFLIIPEDAPPTSVDAAKCMTLVILEFEKIVSNKERSEISPMINSPDNTEFLSLFDKLSKIMVL